MLNKLKFNNLVITHKTDIQRARTQTVNKLVNKIRKLKKVLEKQGQDEKNRGRLLKITQTLEHVKKLNRVDIMKSVLILEKPPVAVLTNGLVSPNELAIALLALNKIMQVLTNKFKSDLQLVPDKAYTWRKELMQTSKKKQKLEHTAEKKKKRQQLKEQKAMERNRKKWLEDNNQNTATTYTDKEAHISTFGEWKVEFAEAKNQKPFVGPVQQMSPANFKRPLEKSKKEFTSKEFQNAKDNKFGKKIKNEESNPRSGCEERQQFHTEATHTIDPFFITISGEKYLSTAVTVKGDPEKINSSEEDGFQFVKLNKHTRDKIRLPKKNEKHQNSKTHTEKYEKNNARYTKSMEALHPSWAAKKKLRQVFNKFEGTRRTFHEDSDENTANMNTQIEENDHNTNNIDLHPSWIAKQKMKPTITAFQGKKIIFDLADDNDNDQ
uniref:Serum response factor-binding protein 1 n=1 Tax=Glossina brevipalpis TaxID=37001 RepID=A0A1A9WH24_9MUSC